MGKALDWGFAFEDLQKQKFTLDEGEYSPIYSWTAKAVAVAEKWSTELQAKYGQSRFNCQSQHLPCDGSPRGRRHR